MWVATLGIVLIVHLPGFIESFPVPSSFGCKNSLISDEWRKMVLNFHNDRRRIVSAGNQLNAGVAMKQAKNMNELVWDCNLEQVAQKSLDSCAAYNGNYGANEAVITERPCNPTSGTQALLRKWWDEVLANKLNNDNEYNKDTIPHFGNMAFYKSTVMACSYGRCGTSTNLLCLYNEKPTGTDALYEAGDTCADNNCKCVNKLCQTTPAYVDDTMTCIDDDLTDDEEQTAEYMHNYYRRIIATGWAKDPKSTYAGYAPIASKMNYLKYNCDNLGAAMKAALNACTEPPAAAGQNVYVTSNYSISNTDALKEAITTWYKGLENGGGIGEDVTYTSDMANNAMLTKYANLAYQDNTQVGCSVKNCKQVGKVYVACKYDGLLTTSDTIYTKGRPCSKCSTNANNKKCETNTDIKALCVA